MGAVYATVADLADRWRPLAPAEEARAAVLLEDAGVHIRAACPDVDERLAATPPELDPSVPRMISAEMVKRALIAGDSAGATNAQETAGPFSQSVTFANPTGDLYLTKTERRLLGCGSARAFSISTLAATAGREYPGADGWDFL